MHAKLILNIVYVIYGTKSSGLSLNNRYHKQCFMDILKSNFPLFFLTIYGKRFGATQGLNVQNIYCYCFVNNLATSDIKTYMEFLNIFCNMIQRGVFDNLFLREKVR